MFWRGADAVKAAVGQPRRERTRGETIPGRVSENSLWDFESRHGGALGREQGLYREA